MKNVRTIRGLALTTMASLGLAAVAPVLADSDVANGAGNLSADASVDFDIVIPRFIRFRVGTNTPGTVDTVTFTVSDSVVGDGTSVTGTGGDATGGAVNVSVISNAGAINIGGIATATGLSNGAGDTINFNEITTTSSQAATLPAPALANGALTAVNVTPTTGDITTRNAVWTYGYDNTNVVAAGTYEGTVTYTAANF